MFQPNFVTFTNRVVIEPQPLDGDKFVGNQNDGFTYVTFADGSSGLEKQMKDWHGNKTGRLYRAEILAAQEYLAARVGEVMNAPVRDCLLVGPTTIIMPYVAGTPGNEADETEPPQNAQGTALKLFDYLVANADRRPKNWISTTDGRIVGIDHALANFRERTPSAKLISELWNAGVEIHPLMELHHKLEGTKEYFQALGLTNKYDTMLENLNRLMAAFALLSQVGYVGKDAIGAVPRYEGTSYENFTTNNPQDNWATLGEGEKDDDTTSTLQEDLGLKKYPMSAHNLDEESEDVSSEIQKGVTPDTEELAPKAVAMATFALELRRKQRYESARFAHDDAAQMFRDAAEKQSDPDSKALLLARAEEQDNLARHADFYDIVGENHAPEEMPADFQKGDVPGHPFYGNQWTGGLGTGLSDRAAKGLNYRDKENEVLYRYYNRKRDSFAFKDRKVHQQVADTHTRMAEHHNNMAKQYAKLLENKGLSAADRAKITRAMEAHQTAAEANSAAITPQVKMSQNAKSSIFDRITDQNASFSASLAATKAGLAAEKMDATASHYLDETGQSEAKADPKFNDPKYINTILPKGWQSAKMSGGKIRLWNEDTQNSVTVKNTTPGNETSWAFGHHGDAILQMTAHLDTIANGVHLNLTSKSEFSGELGHVDTFDPTTIHMSGPNAFMRETQPGEANDLVGTARISTKLDQPAFDMATQGSSVWTVGAQNVGIERVLSTINHEFGHTDFYVNGGRYEDLLPIVAELSKTTDHPISLDSLTQDRSYALREWASETTKNGRVGLNFPVGRDDPTRAVIRGVSEAAQWAQDTSFIGGKTGPNANLALRELGMSQYGASKWQETVAEARAAWLGEGVTPSPLVRKMAELWGWDNPLKKAARMSGITKADEANKATDGEFVILSATPLTAPDGTEVVWSNLGWVSTEGMTFYPDIDLDTSMYGKYDLTDAELARNATKYAARLIADSESATGTERRRMLADAKSVQQLAQTYTEKASKPKAE